MKTVEQKTGLNGYELTLAVAAMVNAVFKAGGSPTKVLIHPQDFHGMADENGKPWRLMMICGVPLEIDPEVEPGKVLAVQPK